MSRTVDKSVRAKGADDRTVSRSDQWWQPEGTAADRVPGSPFQSHLLALEPRILFDGDGAVLAANHDPVHPETAAEPAITPVAAAPVRERLDPDPIRFEANQGQLDAGTDFAARGVGYGMFLNETEALLALISEDPAGGGPVTDTVRMHWEGADPNVRLSGENGLGGISNHFVGNDPDRWATDVAQFGSVRYESLYENIDLVLYGGDRDHLEYDFIIEPGGDPSAISVRFSGADHLQLDESGNLHLIVGEGEMQQAAPFSYQLNADGEREEVASAFVLGDGNRLSFQLGDHDENRTLWIDPVLSYGSYLGGTGSDYGQGLDLDASGNIYMSGYTLSTDFPTSNGLDNSNHDDGNTRDILVAKFDSDFNLVYNTYLGGASASDYGYGVAADASGNAYVTGYTVSSDFPTTVGAYQTAKAGSADVFVTKLDSTGALSYSTYLGGSGGDVAYSIDLDSNNNAYVTGYSGSNTFPTVNAYQGSRAGSNDMIVSKLSADGTSLEYSTYLGGAAGSDYGRAIAVDDSGNAYVGGVYVRQRFSDPQRR